MSSVLAVVTLPGAFSFYNGTGPIQIFKRALLFGVWVEATPGSVILAAGQWSG
jgi:hypothetical protein